MKISARRLETLLSQCMFVLTMNFLALLAVVLQYLQVDAVYQLPTLPALAQVLFFLWPLFFLERLLFFTFCRPFPSKRSLVFAVAISLFPPLRLATRRCGAGDEVWLNNAWHKVSLKLYSYLERRFSLAILAIATFMLPFWVYEIVFPERLHEAFFLFHLVNLGNALVWGVFVMEFTVLLSLAPKPLKYLAKHWLELMIVILPMFALLKFLPIHRYLAMLQLGKYHKVLFIMLTKFQRMLNIYRARTFVNRTVHVLVLFRLLNAWRLRRNPEAYLEDLREKLQEKQEEIAFLETEIEKAQKALEERQHTE